jgi:hypothetical protein
MMKKMKMRMRMLETFVSLWTEVELWIVASSLVKNRQAISAGVSWRL